MTRSVVALTLALMLAGCGEQATLPVASGQGPDPVLPAPKKTLLPTVNIATPDPWPKGMAPTPASGLTVHPFAEGLEHPRWLLVLPNGDILVAETNAPPKGPGIEQDGLMQRIRGWFMRMTMKKVGAAVPSPNRITLLRDADGDGVAELKVPYITGLNSPFGMALIGDQLYVANADSIVRFPYVEGETAITVPPEKIVDLPGGPRNHHWTKNIIARPDGKVLYATVGSNSNVGENGLDEEKDRAAILEIDLANKRRSVFAFGLRNPNGMAFNPASGALWTVVNERDEIGSDLVPDYLTSVQANGFYGWPFSYYGQHVDERVKPQDPALVARAIKPDYALGPHTASLGLTFAQGAQLGPRFTSGVFIGQHGSWNRKPASGYRVIFVPFDGAKPTGKPVDVLTGFLSKDGEKTYGRPVGVVIDSHGGLLVADDVGNRIWRITAQPQQQSAAR